MGKLVFGILDSDFVKDVSFSKFTDEILLVEADGMIDILYEKEGSYLQGKDDKANEDIFGMAREGLSVEAIARVVKYPVDEVKTILAKAEGIAR